MDSPRVAIYLRVSTFDQDTDLQSREIKQYLMARGWGNSAIYEDKASGTDSQRPAFQRLMKDAKSRKIDTIIVWRLDRLSRSMKDLVLTLEDIVSLNISFISLKDNLDLSTSTGRLMANLLACFAQFEADIIRERVRSGLLAAKARGKRIGRPKVNDDERIREMRALGLSYSAIQRQLGVSKGAVCRALAPPKGQLNSGS